ncbi:hypothetical protein AX282_06110 [Bacillus spizizenii]|uniref:hypothetical protein n=1 Tax=Bacillus spizizenii TaxID=96241 RepID=UPI0007729FFD|nr:hypothetical protein [Bacillus spizizenii]KXJ35296.1 hypothetical protein AX282_06110 [Bacillus spizizenii]
MKKILVLAFILLLVLTYNVGKASAVIVKDEEKVSFTMTKNEKWFEKSDDLNPNNWRSHFGYRFTIFETEGCTVNAKIMRMSLSGYEITVSEKSFSGDHFDFSATDQVETMPWKRHYLILTKDPSCGEVKIKGLYGFQFYDPEAS